MNKNGLTIKALNGNVEDIFYNDFGLTWQKTAPGEPEYPKILTKLPIENADDDGTVIYQYNNEYFRCDEFKQNHNGQRHILFAGCSQTEGVGAPLDTVWSKLVYDNFGGNNSNSGFFSIARSGYGWQKIISNFLVYVDKYGSPEYLFVLMPNIGRFFVWDEEISGYHYIQRYPNGQSDHMINSSDDDSSFKFKEKPLSSDEHKKLLIDFALDWKLFEKYCAAIGTKILWGSWDYLESENYEFINISKNYIHMTQSELMAFIKSERPDGKLEDFDLVRRDGHAGILQNRYWATKFMTEAKNRGWL